MKLRLFALCLSVLALAAMPVWGQDVCQGVAGNLVWNCGFETGNFQHWTLTGNTGFTGVTGGGYAYSGNFGAYLGPVGSDVFLTSNSVIGGNTLTFAARQDPSYWGLDSVIVQDLGDIGNYLNLYYVQFALVNFGGPANDYSNAFPYTIYSGYLIGPSIPELAP